LGSEGNKMLELKRNEVKLVEHNPEWDAVAAQWIEELWITFGSVAVDIQHVGSTSIKNIKAKPDMLIMVGLKSMDSVDELLPALQKLGMLKTENRTETDTAMYIIKDETKSGLHTKYMLIRQYGCKEWNDNVNFRDYLNAFPEKATEYEKIKIGLAKQYPNDRRAYKNGKLAFFEEYYEEARIYKDSSKNFLL